MGSIALYSPVLGDTGCRRTVITRTVNAVTHQNDVLSWLQERFKDISCLKQGLRSEMYVLWAEGLTQYYSDNEMSPAGPIEFCVIDERVYAEWQQTVKTQMYQRQKGKVAVVDNVTYVKFK